MNEILQLIHSDQVLWTQCSGAFPAADPHVISLPFQFQLPANLPPSFLCDDGADARGAISYLLEVEGAGPSISRPNPRVRRAFSVVPAASQNQLLVKEFLQQGWQGAWRDVSQNEQLRQGIWGEYSRAAVTLSLPDLLSFPIATSIPYRLHIVTETKTVDKTEHPEDKHGKPLFPIPLTHSTQLQMKLHRTTQVRIFERIEDVKDSFDLQSVRPPRKRDVEVFVDEPAWVPTDGSKDRGFWKRSVHFNSTLDFSYAPTTSVESLAWTYALHFTVPFPGLGNDLKIELPIHLSPSASCPTPPIEAAGALIDRSSYWSGESHDWNEKS
ncbi:hypothetical protein C8R45DRAFT_824019 [Mycena sanguinolenta]|nr:hypothetical protein C8R45DRAFT_824019 [Mycena sanguinolenta]